MGDAADDEIEKWEESFISYRRIVPRNALWKRRQLEMTTSDDFVEVECEFKTATKGAVLIAQEDREIWVPRTLLSWTSDKAISTLERGDEWRMKVREWFASKNDLEYLS